MANFVTFKSDEWNFKIDTLDPSKIGLHSIGVMATIALLKSNGAYEDISIAFEFQITVEDPCEKTSLFFASI